MTKPILMNAVMLLLSVSVANGQDQSVEKIEAAPDAEGVSVEIAAAEAVAGAIALSRR